MSITIGLYAWFYWAYLIYDDADNVQTSVFIDWTFVLLIITTFATLFFFVLYFIGQWKKKRGKVWQSVTGIVALSLLFLVTYSLGNGNPLMLPGYKGTENTRFWLKLTDMWIYSIYILLALNFIFLLGGILWSHFKKMK
jgi:succinate dehydrogenase hydrophobic anchor subunit